MSLNKPASSSLNQRRTSTPKIGKADRTRTAILNAALEFLWTHRFRDLTVASLMASTSAGRSAFYRYFGDLHELMEALLDMLQDEIVDATVPWRADTGDPVALLNEALGALVDVGYRRGPFMRAIVDAGATDSRSEGNWQQFLQAFDDINCARIEADQAQGLIPAFDVRPVVISLTRLNAYTLVDAFGQRPRRQKTPVQRALARVWISTLYGNEWVVEGVSQLNRNT
jgi:AcrR family transcriptional regulator